MRTLAQERADQAHVDRVSAEVRFDQRVIEREHARIQRPRQNRAYVDSLSNSTYHSIIASLNQGKKMKTIARRARVPYNIVVYMWEHDL